MEQYGDAWVCVECYFAHHYGATEHDGQWFAASRIHLPTASR